MSRPRKLPFEHGKFEVTGVVGVPEHEAEDALVFLGRRLPARDAAESILDGVFPPGTVGKLTTPDGETYFQVIAVEADLFGPRKWWARRLPARPTQLVTRV